MSNGQRPDPQKQFPGCMGRMINIFDMSVGMGGTKLLSDKAHRDGSPVRRNQSDVVKKARNAVGVHVEERPIASESRKSSPSKKAGGTPMKMLIAQEMLKEIDSKRMPPNIVAKLMGLDDTMPAHPPILAAKRSSQEAYPRSKSAGALRGRRQQENSHSDRPRSCEIHSCSHEKEHRDAYEVRQQPSRTNRFVDQPLQKGGSDENDRRMALVRQKFVEAKRLATNEKFMQSKEFREALEVLSSNGDLFIKFLEEPNSLFSKHSQEFHTTPQTKRITVLKPSKAVEAKVEKQVKKQQIEKPHRASNFSRLESDILSQPTRIVVLKPSPAKAHDTEAMETTPISSPGPMQHSDFYGGSETGDEAVGSREIAKEITRQMRESVSYRRDESLLSSMLSNGYVGDESSFGKSENEYVEEEIGNFSDSEIMTPSSRHSWDYNNRIGSPYSLSSFSRASYSPESSVIKEAKKRLSERWTMVASDDISNEETQVHFCSNTLGDMLAVPDVKKEEGNDGVFIVSSSRSFGEEEDLMAPSSGLPIGCTKDGDDGESSSRNFSRSKSLPVSSSAYDDVGLNAEASDSHISKPIDPKEMTKTKSGKSKTSLKGKVSSFFSRSKKSGKQKNTTSPLVGTDETLESANIESSCKSSDDLLKPVHVIQLPVNSDDESSKASSPNPGSDGSKRRPLSLKAVISLEKPKISENMRGNQDKFGSFQNSAENQDQPSPISVLDAPFEDNVHNNVSLSSQIVNAGHPKTLSRSTPIGSVARSLSWDATPLESSSPSPLKLSRADEEDQERFIFVQNLLSYFGLDDAKMCTVFARWHSPVCPLDPALLVKFLDRKEERERKSNQRLLFDLANAALLDIGQAAMQGAYPWARACGEARKDVPAGALIAAEVWGLVRGWFSGGGDPATCEADNIGLVVDGLLRKELAGREWVELVRAEMDEISKEIGGKVLEDLVGEALADFYQ